MSYKGQPVPSTTYHGGRAQVSDGKRVRVKVPASTTIQANQFVLLDGFFGAATTSVATGSGETADIVLNIQQAEYETDQVIAGETFAVGTELYWNGTALTEAADDGESSPTPYRKVGRVTAAKDENNVIWFILGPQV